MGEKVIVTADASRCVGKLKHTWNYIGYDECNYTHSPGGMELLSAFGRMEKPYYVRAHHMLCTGICHGFYKWGSTNVYTEDEEGNPVYDYTTIDKMMDILLADNLKPFFELGFMPRDLADPRCAKNGKSYGMGTTNSEYQRIGWAMPPKDYDKWYGLIFHLTEHLLSRYGEKEICSWYFEMWNEPDIFYWQGTHEEYCRLYDYTEAALHAVCPGIRFGGPATTGETFPDGNAGKFLRAFLEHVKDGKNAVTGEKGTRIDFISFHTKGGGYNFDTLAKKQIPSVQTFVKNVEAQTSIIKELGFSGLECVLSEADPDGWAAGGRFDNFNLNFRNTEYYASYVASGYKNVYDFAESAGMDIRPLAWAFMFEGERCFEGTRTFSTQGIRKPVFNLFRFYSMLGENRISLTSSRDISPLSFADKNGTKEGPEIDGWATMDSPEETDILLYCHHDDWDLKDTFPVELTLKNLPEDGELFLEHFRIDAAHSNAYAQWQRQGCPDYPSGPVYDAIKRRDVPEYLDAPGSVFVKNGSLTLEFDLPVHGISLIRLRKR